MIPINDIITLANGGYKEDKFFLEQKKRWCDVYYGMGIHISGAMPRYKTPLGGWVMPPNYFGAEYQSLFENFLFSKHPREGQDTLWWRLSQYKPLTQTPFLQIIQLIGSAIFQDNNYSIELSNHDDNIFIWENNFDGYDLPSWFRNVGIKSMSEDPNGFFVRVPSSSFSQQANSKIDVSIWFVNSVDVLYYKKDSVLIFKRNGYVYSIDKTNIWRLSGEREGSYELTKEDAQGYYAHKFGRLPVTRAGGAWNTHGFFDSFLVKAKAVADEFISSYSSEQLVDKEASHPFIVMAEGKCTSCDGTGRVVEPCDTCEGGFEQVHCRECLGKGVMSSNPGERKLVPIEEMISDHVKIVNPDTTINSYHHNKNNDLYSMMIRALNLWRLDKAESGSAKAIDQERFYLDISDVSNHLFDVLIYDTILDIISYRNVESVNGDVVPRIYSFGIVKPTQYQVKTSQQLLEEYNQAYVSNLPIYLRRKIAKDYVDKAYSGNYILKRKETVLALADKCYAYSVSEQQRLFLLGALTSEDIAKGVQYPLLIDTLVLNKGENWFVSTPIDIVIGELEKMFVPVVAEHDLLNTSLSTFKPIEDRVRPDTANHL